MVVVSKKKNPVLNSRIVIVVCVLILIVIPFAVWLLGFKTPSRPESKQLSNVVLYQGETYTFSYPEGWEESESGVPEGSGSVVYLQPSHADPTVNPHVLLKITPATQKEIATINLVYTLLKYEKMNTTVSGFSAQKYVDVLPSTPGLLHSIAYVFIAKGNIYLLELGYTQTNVDPQLENEFAQVVNSFSLK